MSTNTSSTFSSDNKNDEDYEQNILRVKILTNKGRLPVKGSQYAAGHDLYSARDIIVPARGTALVDTDISINVPYGTYGRVAPRSGLALKNSIDVGAGVIDHDYTGPVGVILFNHGNTDFNIKEGDRIAQLIIEVCIPNAKVKLVEHLLDTKRGSNGFGSSGC